MSKYPQSEKLLQARDKFLEIDSFLSWMYGQDYEVAEWAENDDSRTENYIPNLLLPINLSTVKLIYKYLEIDVDELEDERRQMIEELQNG